MEKQATAQETLAVEVKGMRADNAKVAASQPKGAEAPCIPYTEWIDPKDKKCKLLSRQCTGGNAMRPRRFAGGSVLLCCSVATCAVLVC